MTNSNDERALGPFEMPDYGKAAKKASDNAMYDMYWLWDDDDPHPGLDLLEKADTLTWPPDIHEKKAKASTTGTDLLTADPFKDPGRSGTPSQPVSRPSVNAPGGGLMSNFPLANNRSLTDQAGASIHAGKNADGQRLTERYRQLNPYRNQQLIKTDETLLNARKQTEAIVSPRMGDWPVHQGLGSTAANRHNQGLEYLPAMQGYLQHTRTESIQASNEAEKDFTYQMADRAASATEDAYSRHYESAALSMDGAEASYSKLYPENPRHYEMLPQRLTEPGAQAVEKRESLREITEDDRKQYRQLKGGAEVSVLRYADINSGALAMMRKALPEKEGIVNNPQAFEQHIAQNNLKRKIREKRADMISATRLRGKDAAETLLNIKRWCSETLLGEYAIDLALILGTQGRAGPSLRVMKAMAAVARFSDKNRHDQDAIENARINRQFRFGEDESAYHTRLNEMADRLDQNSSTAVKLLIKVIPDPMRQDFLETYDGLRQDW